MTTFLSTFAQRHFDERPRQSLLAGLASRMDGRNLMQALGSGCRPLQHLAWRRMAEWSEAEVDSLVERSLKSAGPELSAVLKAVSHDSVPLSDAMLERVAVLIESPRVDVRLAAARVVAMKQPLAAIPMLRRGGAMDREVLRTLCLADDPSLIVPLMAAFGFPNQSPPPTIGFVATPEWLGDNHAREPQFVEWLIRNCGYCEDGLCDSEVSREALNLLSSGFSYVTACMTSEPRMTKVAHRWQRRIRAFVWRLLPDELGLQRDDDKSFDIDSPLEVELFLAAVRDSDRMLFIEQKSRPPFDRTNANREPAPTCFHASARYVRRKFIDEPLAQADQWNVPRDHRGNFLIDAARVLLEPNEETRTAVDLARRGKWLSSRASKSAKPRTLVLGNFEPPTPDERLSPGADSVKNLAAACGLDWRGIANWLADAEARWSRCVIPIGIEVQIPKVDPDRFAAWKEALPFLGITSPVRPEFGGMIEAAFHPAKSFHAAVLGPLLLCRLGVIAEPQDMALHISLQGELADGVRHLAFPHLFIHPSQRLRNRPDGSMARVMSKGFVHVHEDAELIDRDTTSPANVTTRRTEFRLFRLFAETRENTLSPAEGREQVHSIELSRGFVSDVMAVQILGSALASDCRQCRSLFGEYADAVERAARELPSEFQQLLSSNYFESTGDPRDEALLALLPIFRCWSSVRQIVRTRDLSSSLDLQFRMLRHRHVQHLLNHWSQDHDLLAPEIAFTDDELQLVLPPAVA